MSSVESKMRDIALGTGYSALAFVVGIFAARLLSAIAPLDAPTAYPLLLGIAFLSADVMLRRIHRIIYGFDWLSLRVVGVILIVFAVVALFVGPGGGPDAP